MRTLSLAEVESVAGGVELSVSVNWQQVGAGAALVGLGIAVVATGGVALGPAAAIGSSIVAATGLGLAATGGVVAGGGVTVHSSPDKRDGGS